MKLLSLLVTDDIKIESVPRQLLIHRRKFKPIFSNAHRGNRKRKPLTVIEREKKLIYRPLHHWLTIPLRDAVPQTVLEQGGTPITLRCVDPSSDPVWKFQNGTYRVIEN